MAPAAWGVIVESEQVAVWQVYANQHTMALIYDRIQAAEQESDGSRDQRMRWAKTIRALAVLAGLTAALGCESADRSEVGAGLIEDVEVLDAGPTDALPSLPGE